MSMTLSGRTVDGAEIPAAGTWEIDRAHSTVAFSVRHLMVAKVRGRFGEFAGTIHVAEDPAESWVDVSIDAASIDTRDEKRDAHLRSQDFFDVESFPTVTFRSTELRKTGTSSFDLAGDLSIRGITRPVVLATEFDGLAADPWGNTRAVFTAETEIDREAFGLTWNQALETGGVLVGKQIKIQIELEAVRAA